ncbi:MAG: (2Fe-2S)-binding protein [Thermoleophilia bacterium]|nr:(2Fe-2S)-binding protein [Thermoleophilia bacterium]
MARLSIVVNGKRHRVSASPDTPLLYVLRNELHLQGPRFGCGLSQCGACTVHMGDKAIRSCVTPVGGVTAPITTLEGLGTLEKPHPVQKAFIDHQAAQCGYCTNGMIMAATAFLKKNPKPTREEIQKAMTPWICRCGTHFRIVAAIQAAAKAMA